MEALLLQCRSNDTKYWAASCTWKQGEGLSLASRARLLVLPLIAIIYVPTLMPALFSVSCGRLQSVLVQFLPNSLPGPAKIPRRSASPARLCRTYASHQGTASSPPFSMHTTSASMQWHSTATGAETRGRD